MYCYRDASTIAKFLNRILGLPVHAQNALFSYFSDILAELIQQAKHDGTYDMGIMGTLSLLFIRILYLGFTGIGVYSGTVKYLCRYGHGR